MATRLLRYTVLHDRTILILNHKHALVIEKRKPKDRKHTGISDGSSNALLFV